MEEAESVYSGTCLEMGKARYFRPKFTSCTITRDVFLHLHVLCWPFRELYYILYPGTTINHMNFFFSYKAPRVGQRKDVSPESSANPKRNASTII